MTEEQVLLAAIRAEPGDDIRRLDYADWLDEQPTEVVCGQCKGRGQAYEFFGPESRWVGCTTCSGTGYVPSGFRERAEFLRMQCELSLNRFETGEPHGLILTSTEIIRAGQLKKCERYWIETNRKILRDQLNLDISLLRQGPINDGFGEGLFSRGFIHTVRCPLATWIAHGPAIVRNPVACVERVEVTDREPMYQSEYGFWWVCGSPLAMNRNMVPKSLWYSPLLSSGEPGHKIALIFATEPDAFTALSGACVEWAWK